MLLLAGKTGETDDPASQNTQSPNNSENIPQPDGGPPRPRSRGMKYDAARDGSRNNNSGVFSKWQPEYAARGIATFPVAGDKKPQVTHWLKIGPRGATALAHKFTDANALGFVTGHRNRITVLDIDVADQRVLEDTVARHGQPHIVVRTASRKFHCWYRFNGERRQIRPWPDREIDILGERGFVLAPPSAFRTGRYEFIHGTLDDLDRLTPMLLINERERVPKGQRNNALWRHCMRHAHHCDDFDALLDVARTYNESCEPPLSETEIMRAAQSAWNNTQSGRNRFGQHGAWFPLEEVTKLVGDQDVFLLLAFLRAHNGPRSAFMITNGLAETLGWCRKRLAAARRRLIDFGYVREIRGARQQQPALYQWEKIQGGQK